MVQSGSDGQGNRTREPRIIDIVRSERGNPEGSEMSMAGKPLLGMAETFNKQMVFQVFFELCNRG